MKLLSLIFIIAFLSTTQAQTSGAGVTDIDGNTYTTVIIGDQEWMSENLKTKHYKNGDEIPNVTNENDWASLVYGAYSIYNNDAANELIYGCIYNGYAFKDARGICPEGWEVPTYEDWLDLVNSQGGISNAGGPLKAVSDLWFSNVGATNASGFSALPNGFRKNSGIFDDLNTDGVLAMIDIPNNLARIINNNNTHVQYLGANDKTGVCVRCIKSANLNIESIENLKKIKIHPNPVQNYLYITLDDSLVNYEFKILDIHGRTLKSGILEKTNTTLNMTDLQSGVYFFSYDGHTITLIKK